MASSMYLLIQVVGNDDGCSRSLVVTILFHIETKFHVSDHLYFCWGNQKTWCLESNDDTGFRLCANWSSYTLKGVFAPSRTRCIWLSNLRCNFRTELQAETTVHYKVISLIN